MNIKSIILSAMAILAVAACEPKPEPVETPSSVDLSKKSLAISADGETQSVALTANCEWTASSSVNWISVAPTSGNGGTTLSVIVDENTTAEARDGKVTVTSKDAKASVDLLVSQAGKKTEPENPDGPDGPEQPEDPHAIKTVEQLSAFFAEAATYTADDEWSLGADIDCGGATISPATGFAGVLDGKDHKIFNYKVASAEATSGLFLTVSGTIKNVILGSKDGSTWDGFSTVTYVDDAPTFHTGGVCADLSGTLENVKNFAKVAVVFKNTDVSGIGGLVGSIGSPAKISNCENGAQIELSGTMGNGAYAGGIVGYANNAEAVIENCVSSAVQEYTIVNAKYLMYGGIAGYIRGGTLVNKCQNVGDITFNNAEAGGTYIMIAGIVGGVYYAANVTNCTNNGAITTNRNQVSRIGGIVGTLNSQGLIEGNVNEGKVSIVQDFANANWQAAGGIVGFQEKVETENIIRNNTNKGAVEVVVENATTHANKVTAGGIIGLGVLGLDVSGNVNEGAVSITNKAAGACYAGGIVGWFKGANSFTKENENKGAVSCKTSDDAASVAGGVVGWVGEKAGTCTSDKNTGAVTCANAAAAGSIAGTNAGTLSNCVAGGSVNGTALTDANFNTLIQGASSTGKAEGTTLAK